VIAGAQLWQRWLHAGAVLSWVLVGCASQHPGPFFGDEKYLVLGVDPDAEGNALIRDLAAHGYRATPTLRGRHFTAVGVQHADLSSIGVRVVTVRGIALSLDRVKPTVFDEEVRYRLLPPPFFNTHDADDDGFEEIFVQVVRGQGSGLRSCVAVYRVRDSGFVDLVDGKKFALAAPPRSPEPQYRDPSFCELPKPPEADAKPAPQASPTAIDASPAAGGAGGSPSASSTVMKPPESQ
jgi:hypothetical protein